MQFNNILASLYVRICWRSLDASVQKAEVGLVFFSLLGRHLGQVWDLRRCIEHLRQQTYRGQVEQRGPIDIVVDRETHLAGENLGDAYKPDARAVRGQFGGFVLPVAHGISWMFMGTRAYRNKIILISDLIVGQMFISAKALIFQGSGTIKLFRTRGMVENGKMGDPATKRERPQTTILFIVYACIALNASPHCMGFVRFDHGNNARILSRRVLYTSICYRLFF